MSKFTVEDTSIKVAYNNMSEHDVKLYTVRMGWVEYSKAMQMSLNETIDVIHSKGHKIFMESNQPGFKYKGEKKMEMFIGKGDDDSKDQNSQQRKIKEEKAKSKHVIRNADSPDVELYFFELIDMSYNKLNELLNDYLDLYNVFKEYAYKMNAVIIMEAISVKKDKEVNVS